MYPILLRVTVATVVLKNMIDINPELRCPFSTILVCVLYDIWLELKRSYCSIIQ